MIITTPPLNYFASLDVFLQSHYNLIHATFKCLMKFFAKYVIFLQFYIIPSALMLACARLRYMEDS